MAPRRGTAPPSERELEVMSVLWALGSGTVAEVRQSLNDDFEPEVAYTTVLTMLRSLRSKGWVKSEVEGRAHRFYPAVELDAARLTSIRRLVDVLFGGSKELLAVNLVSGRGLSPTALRRLRDLLDDRLSA